MLPLPGITVLREDRNDDKEFGYEEISKADWKPEMTDGMQQRQTQKQMVFSCLNLLSTSVS